MSIRVGVLGKPRGKAEDRNSRAKIEHAALVTGRFVREFAASPAIASACRSVIALRVDSVEISGAD